MSGALYRFEVVGKSGARMAGHVEGEYTLARAFHMAIRDVLTGRAEPLQIIDDGRVWFDAREIRKQADD